MRYSIDARNSPGCRGLVETGRHQDGGINGALCYDLIPGGGSARALYKRLSGEAMSGPCCDQVCEVPDQTDPACVVPDTMYTVIRDLARWTPQNNPKPFRPNSVSRVSSTAMKSTVYWKTLKTGDIGIVTILHQRTHQSTPWKPPAPDALGEFLAPEECWRGMGNS